MELKEQIRDYGLRLGFGALGFTEPHPFPLTETLKEYNKKGLLSPFVHHQLDKLVDPTLIMRELLSIIVVLLPYYHPLDQGVKRSEGEGIVSCYAWGLDYHQVMKDLLNHLQEFIKGKVPSSKMRAFVDTGPLLEKELAIRAGLGWRGKNTLLINREWGSFVFIGVLLTDLPLEPDLPILGDCGTCTICLDACPTKALSPYLLDPAACISQATMGQEGIPLKVVKEIGLRIWGCDGCQGVCPYNHNAVKGYDLFSPKYGIGPYPNLHWILSLDEGDFQENFRKTSIGFGGLKRLQSNAKIALIHGKGGYHGEEDFC